MWNKVGWFNKRSSKSDGAVSSSSARGSSTSSNSSNSLSGDAGVVADGQQASKPLAHVMENDKDWPLKPTVGSSGNRAGGRNRIHVTKHHCTSTSDEDDAGEDKAALKSITRSSLQYCSLRRHHCSSSSGRGIQSRCYSLSDLDFSRHVETFHKHNGVSRAGGESGERGEEGVVVTSPSQYSSGGEPTYTDSTCTTPGSPSHLPFLQDGVTPHVFKDRIKSMSVWFKEFNDRQKIQILKQLLSVCDVPQFHSLSSYIEHMGLHQGCPPNCQDILSWAPPNITQHILNYLDPKSLCSASGVCSKWYDMCSDQCLWASFCKQSNWRLSPDNEQKQILKHIMPNGKLNWKAIFCERYKLKRNWLRGHCMVRTFEGHTQGISCVQFDETRIVSGSSDKTIRVWNMRTNSPWSVMTLTGHSATVRCLHLHGNRLVSGSVDQTIKVWDLSNHPGWSSIACRLTMQGHMDTVRCLQVDDDKVVSGSYDRTLKVWDLRTGECRLTLTGHQGGVLCLQFDDEKIVSGSADNTIKVWSLSSGECLHTLLGHHDAVTCLQFDQSRIISGSVDCNLKFWTMSPPPRCVHTIDWANSEGHTGVIRCVQSDAWRVLSAADDRTIKVWSLDTGERLVTLRNHSDGVTCLCFNDHLIVSGSYDKTVKLWDFTI